MLSSGSSGNCTFISTGATRILVDAGLSARQTAERLGAIGEKLQAIDAILISHEHTDHVSGLPVLAKKLGAPVYVTNGTAPGIAWNDYEPKLEIYQAGSRLTIGDVEIQTFTIPHDTPDPVAFTLRSGSVQAAVCTDLGYIPESVKYHLRGSDFLVLESNHDLEMLKVGPYPWMVKQRVMGRKGHLSNDAVSDFILDDLDSTIRTLILGHLSVHNNHPAIVRVSAEQALKRRAHGAQLLVLEHGKQGELFTF